MDFSFFSPDNDLRGDVVDGPQEFPHPSFPREAHGLVNLFDGLEEVPTPQTPGDFTNGLVLEGLPIGGMALFAFTF
jgi:hypothetical protein